MNDKITEPAEGISKFNKITVFLVLMVVTKYENNIFFDRKE